MDLEYSLRHINTEEKYTAEANVIEYRMLAKPKEYPHMVNFEVQYMCIIQDE